MSACSRWRKTRAAGKTNLPGWTCAAGSRCMAGAGRCAIARAGGCSRRSGARRRGTASTRLRASTAIWAANLSGWTCPSGETGTAVAASRRTGTADAIHVAGCTGNRSGRRTAARICSDMCCRGSSTGGAAAGILRSGDTHHRLSMGGRTAYSRIHGFPHRASGSG